MGNSCSNDKDVEGSPSPLAQSPEDFLTIHRLYGDRTPEELRKIMQSQEDAYVRHAELNNNNILQH